MHSFSGRSFLTALALATIATSSVYADDHVIIEQIRSGMGTRFPPRTTEIWLSETGLAVTSGRMITITRSDLQKRWTLSMQTKRYFEEPLSPPAVQPKNDTIAIQRQGWDYQPVYDWVVSEPQKEELVGEQRCRLILADGDADYSTESVELWVAEKVPIDLVRFHERVASKMMDSEWQGLLTACPALKTSFIMKSVDKTDFPIAPPMTMESRVTKIEAAASPPKTYELPEGFQRVKSIEELYN
jgi:hypothetical protein